MLGKHQDCSPTFWYLPFTQVEQSETQDPPLRTQVQQMTTSPSTRHRLPPGLAAHDTIRLVKAIQIQSYLSPAAITPQPRPPCQTTSHRWEGGVGG
jgi:hypothetical protein